MTPEIAAFLVLFIIGMILFATERFPPDVTALGLMLSLILLGLLKPDQAFAGFGSQTVLMILGLLILTETLISTGLVDLTGRFLLRLVGGRVRWMRVALLVGPGILSSFISNTASAAFFLPIALGLSKQSGISPSRLLMPLAFTAILAGSVTLIGTSTNLVVSGLLVQANYAPLGMFELTPVGLPILIVGILYMAFIGIKLVPDRIRGTETTQAVDNDLYFTEIVIPAGSQFVGQSLEQTGLLDRMQLGMLELHRSEEDLKPLADTVLQAGDILLVEGSRANVLKVTASGDLEINGKINELESFRRSSPAQIVEVVILPGSPLIGRTVKGMGLRDRYRMQILAVNQSGDIRHSRIGQMVFNAGDVLLIKISDDNLAATQRERLFRVLEISTVPGVNVRQVGLASAIFVGAMALAISEVVPIAVAVLIGTLLVFITRCIEPDEAYRRIQWNTLILIGSMLAFGQAMQSTGTADFLAQTILTIPGIDSPFVLLTLFFILSVVLTQPMSNQAAAAILVPIAIQTALLVGLNPRPLAIMIALGASASFITPLEPACVLVFSAGRYKFMDFVRVGGLLTVLVYVVAMLLIPLFWNLNA